MKSFKKIAIAFGSLALGLGVIGVGVMAVKAPVQAKATDTTYTWSPTASQISSITGGTVDVASGTVTATWTYAYTWKTAGSTNIADKSGKGVQIGAGSKVCSLATFSTPISAFGTGISQVVITVGGDYSSGAGAGTYGVTANETSIISGSFSTTDSSVHDYSSGTLSSSISSGNLVLSLAETGTKGFFFKSIVITYTESTAPSVGIQNKVNGVISGCIGDTVTLSAAKANADSYSVVWSTSSTSAYSLDSSTGIVTCSAAGSGTITATLYDSSNVATSYTDSVTFTVLTPSITVNAITAAVGIGGTILYTPTNISSSAIYSFSSDTTSVLTVDSTGAYTALAIGSSVVTVTATVNGTVVASNSATVTVIELPTKATFTGATLNLPSAISGTASSSTDSSSGYAFSCTWLKNDSGSIHFSPSNAGYLYNTTAWNGTISRIVFTLNTSNAIATTNFTVTAGTAANPTSTGTVVSNSANTLHYFDVSAIGGTYFKVANNGSTDLKIKTLLVETASDEVSDFVSYVAGKSTGDATTGVTDATTCAANYKAAKQMILYMSAAAITDFKASTDTDTVTARTRYVNWCTANGDASPWSGTIVGGSANLIKSNSTDNGTIVYVVLGAIAVAAFGGYLFLRKKKENA